MTAENFVSYAREKLGEHHAQIIRCVRLCSSDQLWHRANERCNGIGNLLLHLTGNVRQWIVAGLGGAAFERDRPAEFAERGPLPVEPILTRLAETIRAADGVLAGLSPEQVAAANEIQGYRVTGVEAIFHVVEHFAFHTGQIVHMTKVLTGRDVSLYDAHGRRMDGKAAGAP